MATPVFKSGRGGTATLNGNAVPITGWRVDPKTEVVVFKNSQTGRFSAKDTTFHDCQVQIDLDWDSANNPFAAPISVVQGANLTNVILTKDGTLAWTFPLFIVSGTPEELSIAGKVTTRIVGENNGTYTAPGGITPSAT